MSVGVIGVGGVGGVGGGLEHAELLGSADIIGISQEYPRNIPGIFLDYSRNIPGLFLDYSRNIPRPLPLWNLDFLEFWILGFLEFSGIIPRILGILKLFHNSWIYSKLPE